MNYKQTLRIFLADGNPTGLRTLELFNWSGRGVLIPRDCIESGVKRLDVCTQGVYLLLGENEEGEDVLYIGEGENVAERIKSHHKNKDFWDTAICFFSKDGTLNKAYVKYLEELLIGEAIEADRIKIENGNQPRNTKLSESEEADALIFAENIKLILSTVGYAFLKKTTDYEESNEEVYVCQGPNAKASGLYTSEGFVVLKGSIARKSFSESSRDYLMKHQEKLLADGVLGDHGENEFIFLKDYIFKSPSGAADLVLARSANGWTTWLREEDGKTLDEIKRN